MPLIEVGAFFDILLLGGSCTGTNSLPDVTSATQGSAAVQLVGEVADVVKTILFSACGGEWVESLSSPGFVEVLLLGGVDINRA